MAAEVTIDSLQKDLEAANAKNEKLSADLNASNEALEKAKADLVASNKVNADFEELVKSLQSKISEQEALLPKVYTVTIDKKTYVVNGGVRTQDGRILSKEELASDKDVCQWLLEIGSDILTLK